MALSDREIELLNTWSVTLSVRKERKIWVACSGGVDSVVLLWLIYEYCQRFTDWSCGVLHVNYHLRDEESVADQHFVESLSASYQIECKILQAKKPDESGLNSGVQEWARDVRYNWFKEVAGETDAVVAMAHHGDDVAEGFLLKLVRGAGLFRLGMKPWRGCFWRPLLHLRKIDLQMLGDRQDFHYREDSSNATINYSRNRIRHNIIGELDKIHAGSADRIAHLAQEADELGGWIRSQICKQVQWGEGLSLDWILSVPVPVAIEAMVMLVEKNIDTGIQLSRNEMRRFIDRASRGERAVVQLPGGGQIQHRQGQVEVKSCGDNVFQQRFQQHFGNMTQDDKEVWLSGQSWVDFAPQKSGDLLSQKVRNNRSRKISLARIGAAERFRFGSAKKLWSGKQLVDSPGHLCVDLLRINGAIESCFDGDKFFRPG